MRHGTSAVLIGAGLIALIGFLIGWLRRRFHERSISRDPEKVLIWDLGVKRPSLWEKFRGSAPDSGRAIALLEAINRGAERAADPSLAAASANSPTSKADRIWRPLKDNLRAARHGFLMPTCRIYDHGNLLHDADGIAVVQHWLEAVTAGSESAEGVGQISIVGAAGTGKTTFLYALFLKLIGGHPVPMLASADNLQSRPKQIDNLLTAGDSLPAFVSAWLDNRVIVPHYARATLIRSFTKALKDGEIILILDGVDKLRRQGLGDFAKDLLGPGKVRFWIISEQFSNRPGYEFLRPATRIELDETWSTDHIAAHIRQRWPRHLAADSRLDTHSLTTTRDTFSKVIHDVIEKHDKTAPPGVEHWLRLPGNLDFFIKSHLQELTKNGPIDEWEIRRRAESQPYLLSKLPRQRD